MLQNRRPANDNFANRTSLTGSPVRVEGSNEGATTEPNEPQFYHDMWSVWYSWVAPSNGAVRFVVVSTNFFPLGRLYTGATLGDLELVTIAYAGTNRFKAEAGTEYQIRIAGEASTPFPPAVGIFELTMRPVHWP